MLFRSTVFNVYFILICFFIVFQVGIAEAGIQINSHALSQEGSFLDKTDVHYIVTGPNGYKLGYDPKNDKNYNDYPEGKGSYGDAGIDETTSIETIILEPIEGNYTIEIIGSDLMAFSVEIAFYRGISSEGFSKLKANGITDKDFTSRFQFAYTSDPTRPAGAVVRIAAPSSLKQDITLSRKIGWIDNDGIMKSLLGKAGAIEASIAKGNKTAAKNQLTAFINEVSAQKGKHIADKALKILLEDAQYIMKSL